MSRNRKSLTTANMKLNREWVGHIRGKWKRFTSNRRRTQGKRIIRMEVEEISGRSA